MVNKKCMCMTCTYIFQFHPFAGNCHRQAILLLQMGMAELKRGTHITTSLA